MSAIDVIGLGYCSADYLGVVPERPDFDRDTLSMPAFASDGGGPVSTALVALARLGTRTAYLGNLGDDDAGQMLLAAFHREGVETRHVRVQAGGRTPVCMILVEQESGRRAILCYRGTLEDYALTDAGRADLEAARCLHIDGHSVDAVEEAAGLIRRRGGFVVFDANRPRPQLERFLSCTDVLIAASSFPTAATGCADLAEASRRLLACGPRLVVTTLGAEGCFCYSAAGAFHAAGFHVPVQDTTGAGDAFHGAFIYGLLQEWPLPRVARFANAVAALNCRRLGGRHGLPALADVEDFLSAQR